MAKSKITVQGTEIALLTDGDRDYFSLTDIASKFGESRYVIRNWLRLISTLDYLAAWEEMHNTGFKREIFDNIRQEAGGNAFSMSPEKWITNTASTGIKSSRGRSASTYGHSDITLHFCYWLNPIFQLYLLKEFQRLKNDEAKQLGQVWNLRREIAKANYHIHTDAIREHLVPQLDWRTKRESIFFASEADLLNTVVFGMTAKQWKTANPEAKGNLRDSATVEELQVLANMESLNAAMISQGFNQEERFSVLAKRAEREVEVLKAAKAMEGVKKLEK